MRRCGSVLCPTCQNSNPEGSKFCNECGHKFAQSGSDTSAELKIVTVLFSDVSGFTSLSESLAPEELRDLMDGWFDRLGRIIRDHGGTIDKFIGDAVMALFGAPVAREDDPKRAIDAALEMQSAVRDYNKSIADRVEMPLQIRIGINTGRVYAGMIGSGDNRAYTVMGDAVNIASRLESECPVGSVVISQSTQRHVRGLYEVVRLPPLTVKGKSEPLSAYEVSARVAASLIASADRLETPSPAFVRRDELAELVSLYTDVRQAGTPRMMLVVGDAGMGKGEFLRYGIRELGRRGFSAVLSARCHEAGGAPFQFLADALAKDANVRLRSGATATERAVGYLQRTLRASDSDTAEAIRVLLWVLGLGPGELGPPRSVDDPRALRQGVARAAFLWLSSLARRGPVAFRIDNIHRASEATHTLLSELILGEPMPLLIAASVSEDQCAQWERIPRTTVIPLDALDEPRAREVANRLLERVQPRPKRLIDRLVARAGGNPGFMLETVRTLIEDGAIVEDAPGQVWRLSPEFPEELPVPDTIGQLVQARVDRLSPMLKRVLQFAAVAGDRVWAALLEPLTEMETGVPRDELAGALHELARVSVLMQTEQPAPDGTPAYRFRPALARELIYENTVARTRNAWHAILAAWWSDRAQNDVEAALLAAASFERAGDDARAGAMYRRTGDAARVVFANADARSHYQRAAAALSRGGADSATQSAVLESLGDVRVLEGEYDAAADAYDEALELAGDVPVRVAHLLVERGRARARSGDPGAALTSYQEATFILENVADTRRDDAWRIGHAQALYNIGWLAYLDGDSNKAAKSYTEARDLCAGGIAALTEALIEEGLGAVARVSGDIEGAIAATRRALGLRTSAGSRPLQATSQLNLGAIFFVGGRYVAAREACLSALALHKETGNTEGIAIASLNLGAIELELGSLADAERRLMDSLALGTRTSAWFLPENYRYLAEVALAADDVEKAAAHVDAGFEALGETGPVEFRGNLLAARGIVLARQGRASDAKATLRGAMEIHEAAANSFELGVAMYRYAELLLSTDAADEKLYVAKALEQFRDVGNATWVTRCETRLAELAAASGGSL